MRGNFKGPGSTLSDQQWKDFYHLSFVERRSQRKVCPLVGISRHTGREMHKAIRSYLARGEQHPRLRNLTA